MPNDIVYIMISAHGGPDNGGEMYFNDGTGNSFRSYLIYLLDSDLDSKAHRKINERYWTCGRIGDITEKL